MVTPAIAREIGEREGMKAILTGTIGSLGKQYVITLTAQNTATGDEIASEQATAPDKENVLERFGDGSRGDAGEAGRGSGKHQEAEHALWPGDDDFAGGVPRLCAGR